VILPYAHSLFMIAGFTIMIAGFITARFLKIKIWWLRLHKVLGISGVCFVLLGLCFVVIHLSLINAGHFTVPHTHLGLIVVFLSLVTPIMGLMQIKMYGMAVKIRTFHRWSGRTLLILMGINIISGLYTAGII